MCVNTIYHYREVAIWYGKRNKLLPVLMSKEQIMSMRENNKSYINKHNWKVEIRQSKLNSQIYGVAM